MGRDTTGERQAANIRIDLTEHVTVRRKLDPALNPYLATMVSIACDVRERALAELSGLSGDDGRFPGRETVRGILSEKLDLGLVCGPVSRDFFWNEINEVLRESRMRTRFGMPARIVFDPGAVTLLRNSTLFPDRLEVPSFPPIIFRPFARDGLGAFLGARLKSCGNGYFLELFFTVKNAVPLIPAADGPVGVAMGQRAFCVLSDGTKTFLPGWWRSLTVKDRDALAKAVRENDARAEREARIRLSILAERKRAWIGKLARELAGTYGEIYVNDYPPGFRDTPARTGKAKIWATFVNSLVRLSGRTTGFGIYFSVQGDAGHEKYCPDCGSYDSGASYAEKTRRCTACGSFYDVETGAARRVLLLGLSDMRKKREIWYKKKRKAAGNTH